MDLLHSSWILAFVFAFTFYGSGKLEEHDRMRKGVVWVALSIVTSVLVIRVCDGGWLSELLAQIGLFVAIAIFRTARGSTVQSKSR